MGKRWFCVDHTMIGEVFSIHYDQLWRKNNKLSDVRRELQEWDTRSLDELIQEYLDAKTSEPA
jgi:hypothetical protein